MTDGTSLTIDPTWLVSRPCIAYVHEVAQLNVNVTPEFERSLKRLMRLRGISSKSEALRLAVQEAADRAARSAKAADFATLRGVGNRSPVNPSPRFQGEDDLWS